jgi:hypothetical protein
VLEQAGLWKGQVTSVIGYADSKPRNPENPFDPSNRRVSILVRRLTTADFLRLMQVQRDTSAQTQSAGS